PDRAVPTPAPTPTAEVPRASARGVVRVGRGGAVAAALLMVVGSAGVAAAVTGDPAGAFGVRTVLGLVHHRQPASSADQVRRLGERVEDAARRPGGPDARTLAALQAEADRLPDHGGP